MKVTFEIPTDLFDKTNTNEVAEILNEERVHCMLAMLNEPGSAKTIGLLLGQLALLDIVSQLQTADKLAKAATGDATSVAE